jgi:hypothetical protein
MRLVILIEGDTEERTIKDFLAPYCTEFSKVEVLLPPDGGGAGNITSSQRLNASFKDQVEFELDDADTVVFCLIDMKEIPLTYPSYVHDDPEPAIAQYQYIKQFMRERIRANLRDHFYPFPIMQEYETWLLADVEALRQYFSPEIQPYATPESVLDPAKALEVIAKRFRSGRRKEYNKIRDGIPLFTQASAERVYYDNCPHFEDLINTLLEVQGIKPARQSLEFTVPNQELFTRLYKLEQQLEDLWRKYENVYEDSSPVEDTAYEKRLQSIEDEIATVNAEIKQLHKND